LVLFFLFRVLLLIRPFIFSPILQVSSLSEDRFPLPPVGKISVFPALGSRLLLAAIVLFPLSPGDWLGFGASFTLPFIPSIPHKKLASFFLVATNSFSFFGTSSLVVLRNPNYLTLPPFPLRFGGGGLFTSLFLWGAFTVVPNIHDVSVQSGFVSASFFFPFFQPGFLFLLPRFSFACIGEFFFLTPI